MTQPTAIVFSLLKRAASMLQEQRDEIFNSHQVDGRIVADDEFSSNAANAVEEMDQWIRDAGAVLNAADLPVLCIPDDADLLADMQQAQILRLTAPAKPVYEHHITDAMAYVMAGTALPVEWTLQRQAASLAKLVEEWITGGIRGGTDWTSGLEQVLLRRLRRFQAGPVDDKDHPRFLAGYQAGMQDAKRDAELMDVDRVAARIVTAACELDGPVDAGPAPQALHILREEMQLSAAAIRTFMPDTLPANEAGQIHFARALAESAAEAIEKFLTATESNTQ